MYKKIKAIVLIPKQESRGFTYLCPFLTNLPKWDEKAFSKFPE